MKRLLAICSYLLVACSSAATSDISGTYIDENNPSSTLVLTEKPGGTVVGHFEGLDEALPIAARREGERLTGTVGSGEEAVNFAATIAGDRIVFELTEEGAGQKQVFVRTGGAEAVAGASAAAGAASSRPAQPASGAATGGRRNVVVNDERLSDETLTRLEQTYRVKILDADYWYDKLSGAWGIKGGPTRGFIYSGLDLGGPLKANASSGGTRVFINGRELHPLDVSGLQRCTQVNPGRYWVLADGTGGYEGGPPSFNLVQLCSATSGGRSGGWLCDGGSCGTTRTVTGPYAVTTEGGGAAGVYTDQGLILTPN